MNIQTTNVDTAAATRSPYKVDVFAGSRDGEVSTQWASRPYDQRFLSLDDLHDAASAKWEGSFETRSESAKVEIIAPEIKSKADMHKLSVGVEINTPDVKEVREVAPTHYAFNQLCTLAKAPAKFMRELPSPLVSDTLNYRLRYAREVEEIKLYGGATELFAATGPDYGRIPDYQVVDAVRQIAGSGRGERRWKAPGVLNWQTHMYDPEAPVTIDSTTFYWSDRDVFIFLVDDRNPIEVGKTKDGEPDLMFRGFYVQNSEVGARALKLSAFYLRAVCMNRNLWGVEGLQEIRIPHTRLAPDRWLTQCVPALNSYANGSDKMVIEGVQKAKAAKLVDNDEEAIAFLTNRRFSGTQARAILETSVEQEDRPLRTAWDFMQGITAFARTFPNTDDRLFIEVEAKKIGDKAAGVKPNSELIPHDLIDA